MKEIKATAPTPHDWIELVRENAKAAVREFALYIGQSDKCERYLEAFETKKNVADAVEYYNGELPEGEAILGIAYSNNKIVPYYAGSPIADGTNSPDSYIICTREQFEAYVKDQEGEKWTHTWNGRKCRVVFTEDYTSWIKCEGLKNAIAKTDDLKPIKPTMTEEQQKMVAKFVARIYTIENSYNLRDEFDKFCNEHDII